jgi:N-acetyl-beta-hexosaminidase
VREVPDRSDALNPLAPGASDLIARMVEDIATLRPLTHFHLGRDEASTFGRHRDMRAYIAQHGRAKLDLLYP